MDVLLDDVVTAEPVEEIPIAHLILELREPRMRNGLLDRSTIPVAPEHAQLADRAVPQPSDGFQILGLVVTLKTHADLQALLFGHFSRGDDAVNARRVGGN